MSKRFKRQKADSSLFHHGLVKLIVVYHLSLHGDSWRSFLARNGFEDLDLVPIDKPVVIETKAEPPVPLHILLPKPSADPKDDLLDIGTDKSEPTKKPMSKNPKENPTANAKGKRNARLILRMARNKAKPSAERDPNVVSEDSDSDVERFLANEYPYS
jgi:hypothetical protein